MAAEDRKTDEVFDDEFGSLEAAHSLRMAEARDGFGSRMLPRAAMLADGVLESGEEFDFAEHEAIRSVKSAVAMPVAQEMAPRYRSLERAQQGLFEAGMDDSEDWLTTPNAGPFGKADNLVDASEDSLLAADDFVHPPMLPCVPYPLEQHTYSLSMKASRAVVLVNGVLMREGVDADFIRAESRWECVKVCGGARACFHLRMYTVASGLAAEFQRRQGCSVTFNNVVASVLTQLETDCGAPLALFTRSNADSVALPAIGFAVGSFDIPDVALDLDFSDLPAGGDAGGLLSDSPVPMDGVPSLVSMASSSVLEVQQEGMASLAKLSETVDAREQLMQDTSLPRAVTSCLLSDDVTVAGAAATVLANVSEDKQVQPALVKAGCIIPVLRAAARSHTARDAHLRRECLRALANLTATQSAVISKAGGDKALSSVLSHCQDSRMRMHASRAQELLA